MQKNKKNIYVLYKVIKNDNNEIIDLKYIYELYNYYDISKKYNLSNRDIKKMLNSNINDYTTLNIHNNLAIIKETL